VVIAIQAINSEIGPISTPFYTLYGYRVFYPVSGGLFGLQRLLRQRLRAKKLPKQPGANLRLVDAVLLPHPARTVHGKPRLRVPSGVVGMNELFGEDAGPSKIEKLAAVLIGYGPERR
jgi:hypothetical protein